MNKKLLYLLLMNFFVLALAGQQPKYTPKHFVSNYDTVEFKRIIGDQEGFQKVYFLTSAALWDVDDDFTTYIKFGRKTLICIEGKYSHGQRNGIYTTYVIDSMDHSKRFKIAEQTYVNDKLNGEWRTYCLSGNLQGFQTFKDDSLRGIAKTYWIDGETIMEEQEYFEKSRYRLKTYSHGTIEQDMYFENELPQGLGKRYYPDGKLKEELNFKAGIPNGPRKYFYPSGNIWAEMEERNGKPWNAVANYTEAGIKRDPGNLKEGNGTLILYKEDGTVREIVMYKNGEVSGQ